MFSRTLSKLILVVFVAAVFMPMLLPHTPVDALKNPCSLDPENLIVNGSMASGGGSTADGWQSFVLDGSPQFSWVGNEQIDPNGSQFIVSTGTFDAGVYQTVHSLQPNVYYSFRLGYSLAAKSYSGPNVRVDTIGRKVGVDPFGGTDPRSPNILWGRDYFDGLAALNIPDMSMIFAARSPNATIFLRAMARDGSGGENKVWFDAVCMEAKPEMGIATSPPPTATTIPPTGTVRPSATRPPATKVALPPTATATATTIPNTPTPKPSSTIAPTPRIARPDVPDTPANSIDLGTVTLAGLGGVLLLGSGLLFFLGLLFWRRFEGTA
jgi:hypothetical protein